jgi:glycerol-3-phosphate cytidylyltransferase
MEIYGGVLERYHKDPHGFGLSSYEYKKKSGRIRNSSTIVGYLSGTFDLFHVGHLNLIRRAKAQCDYLIVGVHPDASHKNKQTFIPFEERKEVVGAVKYVDKVVTSCPEDDEAWRLHHYDKLFVGSDYKGTPRFNRYEEYFKDKGVEIVYFPYTTTTNSTMIRDKISKKTEEA